MQAYLTVFRIKVITEAIAIFKNPGPLYKAQVSAKILINILKIGDISEFSWLVGYCCLPRQVTIVVIGLEGFMEIKLSCPTIVS